tara:strand:- start:117 stop:893 length:777 start_codon:yes stop_codon:yes gene_type:complete
MTEQQDLKNPKFNFQLTKATIDLLRNFSTINKSILIGEGKTLQTMSVNKNIIALTQVREEFPCQMAIYDLPLFLGALSLFQKPWLAFPDDKKVIIYDEETKGKTTFYYSDPEIIVTPPEFNPDAIRAEIMFDLPQKDIAQLMQAAKVYGVEDLCIQGYSPDATLSSAVFSICVKDKKNQTSNVFSLPLKKVMFADKTDELEEIRALTKERLNFCYCFKVENLKLTDASYHVTITEKNIANFNSLSHSMLDYYVAMEPS